MTYNVSGGMLNLIQPNPVVQQDKSSVTFSIAVRRVYEIVCRLNGISRDRLLLSKEIRKVFPFSVTCNQQRRWNRWSTEDRNLQNPITAQWRRLTSNAITTQASGLDMKSLAITNTNIVA